MRSRAAQAIAAMGVAFVAGCDQILVQQPKPGDLAGTYELTSEAEEFLRISKHYASIPHPVIELRLDGTVLVRNLPDCAVTGFCESHGSFLFGRGFWTIEKAFVGYGLTWDIREGDTLPAGIYSAPWVAIRRRSPPYELELTVGDPDSGERIRYRRSSRERRTDGR